MKNPETLPVDIILWGFAFPLGTDQHLKLICYMESRAWQTDAFDVLVYKKGQNIYAGHLILNDNTIGIRQLDGSQISEAVTSPKIVNFKNWYCGQYKIEKMNRRPDLHLFSCKMGDLVFSEEVNKGEYI